MSTLILCFHRIAHPDHGGRSLLAISPEDFEKTLTEIGRSREFVTLEESSRPSSAQRAVVTFDDGYLDNLTTALPILESRGIPATFFLSTGFIDSDLLFPPDALDAVARVVADSDGLRPACGREAATAIVACRWCAHVHVRLGAAPSAPHRGGEPHSHIHA